MDNNQINAFMAANSENFPADAQAEVRKILADADEAKSAAIMGTSFKKPMVMFIIAFFLGGFGVDRFMLGQTGLGIVKFLTAGACGIWSLIDLFTAFGRTRQYNLAKLRKL